MTKRYLSFIIYHLSFSVALLSFSVALLSACSSDDNIAGDGTLSGNGKTPLHVAVSLNNGQATTRAADKTFAARDELKVYLRHTTATTKQPDPENLEGPLIYPTKTADQAPRLVTFTVKDNPTHTPYTLDPANTNETSDLTVSYNKTPSGTASELYWDDFSNSSSTDTDLRTAGHGLQSYYGYCYNGGTPSKAITEASGTLGWTLATEQSSAEILQHQDLLWSMEQAPVTYDHSTARNGNRTGLTIPFTHAMSEITVTLTADATFSASPFTSTSLTLNNMNTVVYPLSARDTTFTSGTLGNITMCGADYTTGSSRNFTAIVAPGTKLKEGELLLNINGVDGNNYTLNITAAMLADNKWATPEHSTATTPAQQGTEEDKKFILTKPGYNYHLKVNLSKTKITERATIKNWETVNATGEAIINFPKDLTANVKGHGFVNGSKYNLFQLEYGPESDDSLERTNAAYKFVTAPTYSNTTETWTNSPTIYWPNATTRYYFRALAKQTADHKIAVITDHETIPNVHLTTPSTPNATAADPNYFKVKQGGDDILWGTTPAHNEKATVPVSYDYPEGAAIYARTDSVPIAFEHALAKVTFKLATSEGAVGPNNNAVNLTGATIAVSNLVTSGTIQLEAGDITEKPAATANAISATTAPIEDLIVIPQAITNASIITITLSDGTVYRLQLNQCKDGSDAVVGIWERGNSYTYTITILKEEITFRALIKDWEEQTGSGVANLEWD